MIDWAEDFDEVVELFLEEVDEAIVALRDLTDLSELEPQCHFLKGSALNIGQQREKARMWTLPPLCKAMQSRVRFS